MLRLLITHIQTHLLAPDGLFVDLPGCKNPTDLFIDILPDITVIHNHKAFILELTCYYERNLEASKEFKLKKYYNPAGSCKRSLSFIVRTAAVSSLGFIPVSSLALFCKTFPLTFQHS